MRFDPERAAIRFGCGLSARHAPPSDVAGMLTRLQGQDHAAEMFPIPGFAPIHASLDEVGQAVRKQRNGKTEAEREQGQEERRAAVRRIRITGAEWFRQSLLRRALGADGFRERLTQFWGDHFTAVGKGGPWQVAYLPYLEEAIRPHLSGRFADMLKAVIVHPMMLEYLDQKRSVGPNSVAALRNERLSGLNENLAREVMELHTLGAGGPYTQADVRQLAELLTGLNYDRVEGFRFRPAFAEPGAEMVLGRSYGGETPQLSAIMTAMEDLATHPATARHIARKLAVHFVSDQPDPDLISAMAARFEATGGNLPEVYGVLLDHPASWHDGPGNVKQPIDFVGSSLRALDLVPRHVPSGFGKLRRIFLGPMTLMGQSWGAPLGPDGWPEADDAWITPQRMAARLQWGMTAPFTIRRLLPDPREFVETALGRTVPEPVRFAAASAETRAEAVGLVLASPAFQRM